MINAPTKINKTIVIVFSICLVLVTVFSIVFPLSQLLSFYEYSFAKNDIAAETGYTNEQLSQIAIHIIRFLKGEAISFHYELNGKPVFSQQAIIHMADVRELLFFLQRVMLYILILFVGLIIYIYLKRKQFKDILFKYSLITFTIIIGILLVFAIIAIIDFDYAFTLFHRIIFFNNEQKFNDSFFGRESNYPELAGVNNQMLVLILSESFFIDFAIIVVTLTLAVIGIYLLFMWLYKKKREKVSVN